MEEAERGMLYVVACPVCVGPRGRDGGGSDVEEVELGIVCLVVGRVHLALGGTGGKGGDLLVGGVDLGDGILRGERVEPGGTEEAGLFMEKVEHEMAYSAEG